MKTVKIFSNANHEVLEELANQAVNDPNFSEIHYDGHSILVIYDASDTKEKSIPSDGSLKGSQ